MSSARDDLGVTIRVTVARRPPAWTPPPADRARRGGSLPTLGVLPEQPEVDAAAVGVSWQMDALQRPKHRLRHHPQAAAAPLHTARSEAPTDYSATLVAAVRRAVRPGLRIETSKQQVVQAYRPAGARRRAHMWGTSCCPGPRSLPAPIPPRRPPPLAVRTMVGGQAPPL